MKLLADILIVLGVVGLTLSILLLPVDNSSSDMGLLGLVGAGADGLLTTGVLIHRRRVQRGELRSSRAVLLTQTACASKIIFLFDRAGSRASTILHGAGWRIGGREFGAK
jgi:hypothetical protein